MSAAEGEPEGVSQGGPDGPGLEEALELLRSLHKKVGKLEKKLEAQAEGFQAVQEVVAALQKTVAKKKHLKRLKKVLDQLEVVELADDGSGGNHAGN
ncbi:MAG: hypothetical protein IPG45_17265 [Deltaproteobacteria bacterium]|nr:hypothetical protein [Deltaproteobacteria bacterium]